MADMVKITIDGIEYEVPAGKNVLQACLDLGILVPHFCYHEALGPAGACRLCAAMIAPAADKPTRLDMTCMTRTADGMIINVNDDYARKFRKQVIEDLMLNHPHDCPVCDEGGECMLQDMTVLSEHQHRRTRFPKRTWANQYLGPLIHHEMNRCIVCYRCVRYYREYALGHDLGNYGSRSRMYFGRYEEGVLESEFAGNLVDVCPTGVFTNKRYRETYSRPWDLQTARSVCIHCSVGCNLLPGYRKDTLRRVKPLENPAVNKFFICDRGRYGPEYVNHPSRLKAARVDGSVMAVDAAAELVSRRLMEIAKEHGPRSIAAIGSPRASLEANAALSVLMKSIGGRPPLYFASEAERAAVRRAAAILTSGKFHVPGLPEMEQADFVLNLGGDLTGEAPMIDLSVRQAIRKGAPFFDLSPRAGKLDEFARAAWRVAPSEQAGIVRQIAAGSATGEDPLNFVKTVSEAMASANRPLIICSTLHEDPALVEAAYMLASKVHTAERPVSLAYAFPAANSVGIGMAREDSSPDACTSDLSAEKIKAIVVLERDVLAEFPAALANALARSDGKGPLLITIDCFDNATTLQSYAVIPCVSHYQAFGTIVNYEGRAQRFEGMHLPGSVIFSSSELLLMMLQASGASTDVGGTNYHDIYDVQPQLSPELDALKPTGEGLRLRRSSGLGESVDSVPPTSSAEWKTFFCFGSEPLSALAPPIAELAPEAAAELNAREAEARKTKDGDTLKVGDGRALKVKVNEGLASGCVAVPVLFTNTAREIATEATVPVAQAVHDAAVSAAAGAAAVPTTIEEPVQQTTGGTAIDSAALSTTTSTEPEIPEGHPTPRAEHKTKHPTGKHKRHGKKGRK